MASDKHMIKKLLIANRGEIALRIVRACKPLGIKTVGVYSTADSNLMHLKFVDEAICIGEANASKSYLDANTILTAAEVSGADAIHPGYGFLSENAEFAEQVIDAGLTFVGPHPDHIRLMGNKVSAIHLMKKAGVPTVPGSVGAVTLHNAEEQAKAIGFPLLIKAASGGGGRGMRVVERYDQLINQVQAAQKEAEVSFGDDTVYMERFLHNPRHVEVQILGDGHGNAIHLYDRDCSLQRRHQKILEEAPAPNILDEIREPILTACVRACKQMQYRGAGTFEFLYEDGEFFFIEMNTRIQVEHPVTEMITGIDIVSEQLKVAAGYGLSYRQDEISMQGHAIECRINAEDAVTFLPSPGKVEQFFAPSGAGVRFDSHLYAGYVIPSFYDSLIGKLVCHAQTRKQALAKMHHALDELIISGINTNVPLHRNTILTDEKFAENPQNIHYLEKHLLS